MAIEASNILGLLSIFYLCKPTKEAVENWRLLLSEDIPDSLLKLKDALDKIDLNSDHELEDLLWEFTRLFIGPYKLPCPPWESVYTSGRRLMMQEARDQVQDFYSEVGLKIGNPNIMTDHIGAELNFLAVLHEKMDGNPEKGSYYTNLAKRFLDEHLMKWIPQFTLDMEESTSSRFYKSLAQVTRDLMLTERNILGTIVEMTVSAGTEASDHARTI